MPRDMPDKWGKMYAINHMVKYHGEEHGMDGQIDNLNLPVHTRSL